MPGEARKVSALHIGAGASVVVVEVVVVVDTGASATHGTCVDVLLTACVQELNTSELTTSDDANSPVGDLMAECYERECWEERAFDTYQTQWRNV